MPVNWDAVNGMAAWSALALTLTQLGRDEVRRRKAEKDKEGDKLRLDVSRDGADALVVGLSYRPGTDHTRYGVIITCASPRARLSIAGYAARDPVFILPRTAWNKNAVQATRLDEPLKEYGGPGEMSLDFAVHALGGLPRATLSIEIRDLGADQRVLRKRMTVTA